LEQPGGLPGQRTCAYGVDGTSKQATVGYLPGGRALFDTLRAQLGPAAEDVPGLGDAAARDTGYVNVLKGQTILVVAVNGMGGGEAASAATLLATAAVARL
jgi:hypothetical protein